MPRTLAQLVTEVEQHLDATSIQGVWTTVDIRTWILEGARDIARRARVLMPAVTQIAVTASTQQYSGPTDLLAFYRMEFQPTGQSNTYLLQYKDYNAMDNVWSSSQKITQGRPMYYTTWGHPPALKIILYPIPSQSGNLNVFYYQLPADLATDGTADSSTVSVPEGWWDLISMYAEFMCLRKDRDPRWQEAKQLYELSLDQMVQNTRRFVESTGSFEFGSLPIPGWLAYGEEWGY